MSRRVARCRTGVAEVSQDVAEVSQDVAQAGIVISQWNELSVSHFISHVNLTRFGEDNMQMCPIYICLKCCTFCILRSLRYRYRVTIQLVQLVVFTSKQRMRFSIRAMYLNATFILLSTQPCEQAEWSTCTSKVRASVPVVLVPRLCDSVALLSDYRCSWLLFILWS